MVNGLNELELKKEIAPAFKELSEPLDTNDYHRLAEQLARAESLIARIATLKRNASQTLSEAQEQALPPKSKEHTELDRKVIMEASTAPEAKIEGLLSDYEKKLYNRVSLGQTLMSSHTQEMKSMLK